MNNMKVGDLVYDYQWGDVGTIVHIFEETIEIYWRDWNSRSTGRCVFSANKRKCLLVQEKGMPSC